MDTKLSKIHVEGFKSIHESDIIFGNVNVLIGSNGSGKSNLLSIFSLLRSIRDKKLSLFVGENVADSLFFEGIKTTDRIKAEFFFGKNSYGFTLVPSNDRSLMFEDEYYTYNGTHKSLGTGHTESKWESGVKNGIDKYVQPVLDELAWRIYHFQDTSRSARLKLSSAPINDNTVLREDASNLAPFLYMLKRLYKEHYDRIADIVRLAAPYFEDFSLRPDPYNRSEIILEWTETGNEERFSVHQLSDGTLRFICLTVLLCQPPSLQPTTIVIDEPELGLHPMAIALLGEMIRSVEAEGKQVIVSTQSVELLNQFDPSEVIVADRYEKASVFSRPDQNILKEWLEDYSLGEIWNKNLLGGRP